MSQSFHLWLHSLGLNLTQIRVIGEELERLRQEAETWKDRWLSERRDHEATIEHCDRIMNSAADHGDR